MFARFPKPLAQGSTIAITAFSSGVSEAGHARLDLVLRDLKTKGYRVLEGQCLRRNVNSVSGSAQNRAEELMRFLLDPSIDAVFPPWGGEYAMELLPLLDYAALRRVSPKWILGFSDVSTLAVALTQKLNWVTVHSANLMELHNGQRDPLTAQTLTHLRVTDRQWFEQQSSAYFQRDYIDFTKQTDACLNLTEPTHWQALDGSPDVVMEGRLLGGCLDILFHLAGTEYFDLAQLRQRWRDDNIILYLENCEMSIPDLKRALLNLVMRGVFANVAGVVFGRNAGPESCHGLTYRCVLHEIFDSMKVPVLLDADIGHLPPNLCLMNGAKARITFKQGKASVRQWRP